MIILANAYVTGFVFLAIGLLLGYGLWYWRDRHLRQSQELQKNSLLDHAHREADTILREARLAANEEILREKREQEEAYARNKRAQADLEQRLVQRDALINHQLEELVHQEKLLADERNLVKSQEANLAAKHQELTCQTQSYRERLMQAAHLSETEARTILMKQIEQETLKDASDLSRHILEEAKIKAEDQARRIISTAIQRYAGDHSFQTTTAAVSLPNEEIKGRIIGKEGRNIRAFEAATGVTVLIDDTPNAVVLSSFDPVRREIAREAMHRLILDGRIHPTSIEEVVTAVSQEIEDAILHSGEEAVFKVGLPPMPIELVKMLGRLRFRHSYSQNILDHSIEVAHLSGIMAAELGLSVVTAKRAGLLHDIGKAVNHEVEGAHAIIGADIVKRHGESDEIVAAVASHHGEVPPASSLGILVSAADAISASRPGARSETMTTYIRRLENLEKIGLSFPGVDKCFAVQAGRELRIFVHPDKVNDEQAFSMARSIVRTIEDELQYPGQIRVTVIRETRCVEYAK
jgi:ribonucrease Y